MTALTFGLSVLTLGALDPSSGGISPDAAHWSYAEQNHWEGECLVGQAQSPVRLLSGVAVDLPDLGLDVGPTAGGFVNNGHTLQFTPESENDTMIGSDVYGMAQFHFHAPSEHSLDGKGYPVEIHFVNRDVSGALAVVGVFLTEGSTNPTLAALLAALPDQVGDGGMTHPTVNLALLLPEDRHYFAYAGSLTTPPCTEGVRWNVLSTPIEASEEQIAALAAALGVSNRALQEGNARAVSFGE